MTGWTFSPTLRSLFRAAGLGLLSCYLVIALSRLYPLGALAQPAAVLRLIDQLLDQGPLLCIALLLLLLSLSAYILPPPDGDSPPAPGHRDSLLMRGRALVGAHRRGLSLSRAPHPGASPDREKHRRSRD